MSPMNRFVSVLFLLFVCLAAGAQRIAVNPKFGAVSDAEVDMTVYEPDTSAVALMLYRSYDLDLVFDSNIAIVQEITVHERIKVLKEEGKKYADFSFLYLNTTDIKEKYSGVKVETYNRENGKVVKTKMSKKYEFDEKYSDDARRLSFTAENVRVGSVIEVTYQFVTPRFYDIDNIYLQRGDIRSLMLIRKVDNLPQLLQLVLDIAPDSPTLPVELQRLLFSLENNPFTLENKVCADGYEDHEAVLRIAQQAAKTTILSRRAMWSYTAACLLDYNNKPAAALQQLEGIDNLPCDPFLQQSIRVLRFYLRCKTDKMSDAFEQYAIGELQWMDSELQKEWKQLSPKERKMYQHLESVQTGNLYRSCFMYDAMRRIVLPDSIGLAYRLALAERPVRALQVANMAENRFFILAGNTLIPNLRKGDRGTLYQWKSDVNQHPGFATAWCSWMDDDTTGSRGCAYNINWNGHDYCNWMFLLADKMEAKTLEAYRERQLHPLDATDRWFNERGYLGSDYWEDIIGTHHLRECNYPAAVEHLRLVSPAYQQCMNLSFELDPFSLVDKIPNQDKTGYRLHFAERMVELQKLMKSSDPDVSGTAMLEYSIGMRNSYDLCWYLTTYGRSSVKFVDPLQPLKPYEYAYRAEEAEWSWSPLLRLVAVNQKYKSRHTLEANVLQQKALKTIKSDEAKAQAYARLGKYETLVKRYTRTATAQHYAVCRFVECSAFQKLYFTRRQTRCPSTWCRLSSLGTVPSLASGCP